LTILVVIDEPETSVYGGVVAAPVFREIADEALRYLQVPPDRTDAPVAAQPLQSGAAEGGVIELKARALKRVSSRLAMDRAADADPDVVPDFRGLSVRAALRASQGRAFVPVVEGHGVAVRQDPAPGRQVPAGAKVKIWFEGRG
jgi:cell division protein FtsI (penicillin-binding protein 3)